MKIPGCTTNKPIFCFCHWCKKFKLKSRRWMWKHEDSCIDNPEFIKKIRVLNKTPRQIMEIIKE